MIDHQARADGLTYTDRFKAVSTFATIVAPMQAPRGQKALSGYLGEDRSVWRKHDVVARIEDGARMPILLVDQGGADNLVKRTASASASRASVRESQH